MLEFFVALFLALFPSPLDADFLREAAPYDLSPIDARVHLSAARSASLLVELETGVRLPAKILTGIAKHESAFTPDLVFPEGVDWVDGQLRAVSSCGVMTPEPLWRCQPGDVVDGYVAGARHLAVWMRQACVGRSRRRALEAYAGGCAAARRCAAGARLASCAFADYVFDVASRVR